VVKETVSFMGQVAIYYANDKLALRPSVRTSEGLWLSAGKVTCTLVPEAAPLGEMVHFLLESTLETIPHPQSAKEFQRLYDIDSILSCLHLRTEKALFAKARHVLVNKSGNAVDVLPLKRFGDGSHAWQAQKDQVYHCDYQPLQIGQCVYKALELFD
jgi:hypothetical protein